MVVTLADGIAFRGVPGARAEWLVHATGRGPVTPGQLDVQFALVAFHFEFDLDLYRVRHVRRESHPATLELDVVVAGEHVGRLCSRATTSARLRRSF